MSSSTQGIGVIINTDQIYRIQADLEFQTSSTHRVPEGYKAWRIRNDYPPPIPEGNLLPDIDSPWLQFSFDEPEQYMAVVREYCYEGMTNNNFVPQKNTVRQWYHPPWLHPGADGREPLHGLRCQRFIPPRELSFTQQRYVQTWSVAFFNAPGASVFGGIWGDPAYPSYDKDASFPDGTAVCKLVYTNATDEELPNLKGAPEVEAMIAVQPDDPNVPPDPRVRITEKPAKLRLLQMDIAVGDRRAELAWTWGTFMYDSEAGPGYDGMIPVGLSWGIDGELTQDAYDKGFRVRQTWINPRATEIRKSLRGGRPDWGWNGRLCGPIDNFISACQSCHKTSQWVPSRMTQGVDMVPPAPIRNAFGQFVPVNDRITMSWFQNLRDPPITGEGSGAISGDNSFQLMIGWENFVYWRAKHKLSVPGFPALPGGVSMPDLPEIPSLRRQGPDMGF